MRLDEYQWSRNPRGMHNKGAPILMNREKLLRQRMGWGKIVALTDEYVKDCVWMRENGITPIVRIFRPEFGSAAPDQIMINHWRAYASEGVKWFEFYNEPNLGNEWPAGTRATFRDIPGIIAPLMTHWLAWAEMMIEMGCYPAFPALAEATGGDVDVRSWHEAMIGYLAENFYDRFRAVAQNGLWVATHPYIYNHYYQEGASPTEARPPDQQRAGEPGWRFEYPYDPITQADKPGLTTVSGPPDLPLGDVIGLTGMGDAFMRRFADVFGGGAIPVVGTEGGITPVPSGAGGFEQLDSRFPGYTGASHAEATVAMFDWIAYQGPPWMFGVALWKEDLYYEGEFGPALAVQRLSETPAPIKTVPPLEPLVGPGPEFLRNWKGPGPIHGSPDYHFVMLAPGFSADWFFEGGRAYWERFKPQLVPSLDFVALLNYPKSLGITLLATPDVATITRQQILERFPAVWVDLLEVRSAEEVARVLNERAQNGRRFG